MQRCSAVRPGSSNLEKVGTGEKRRGKFGEKVGRDCGPLLVIGWFPPALKQSN